MSDIRPTLYVTNWSSRKLHGPGRKFSIMARPRRWEHGDGQCRRLTPNDEETKLMLAALANRCDLRAMGRYRRTLEARLASDLYMLQPGLLVATNESEAAGYVLADGDTLCCACARGAECHRRWAVPFLRRAGWRVVLDGEEVGGG